MIHVFLELLLVAFFKLFMFFIYKSLKWYYRFYLLEKKLPHPSHGYVIRIDPSRGNVHPHRMPRNVR